MYIFSKGMTAYPNINEEILNFVSQPYRKDPNYNQSHLESNMEFNARGFHLPRQSGKTTAIHKVFTDCLLTKNVILFTKLTKDKNDLIESVHPEFRDQVSGRVFTKVTDLMSVNSLLPLNQKDHLILLDDFTVRGFFSSIKKPDYDCPFKVLAMA